MATNPMQRKARNSFLLGMLVMVLISGVVIAFLFIQLMNKNKKEQEPQVVKAKLNFVLTTYYKGTGMEEVLKKLEQYVDNCDKSENDITFI